MASSKEERQFKDLTLLTVEKRTIISLYGQVLKIKLNSNLFFMLDVTPYLETELSFFISTINSNHISNVL